jgi:hypothetical protein
MEIDFEPVLKDKNALVSLKQINRELENTQDTIWSPLILMAPDSGDRQSLARDGLLHLAGRCRDHRPPAICLRQAERGFPPRVTRQHTLAGETLCPLIQLVIVLVVFGVILWAIILTYRWMRPSRKS